MKKYGLGIDGESLAAGYLSECGYTILERNYISRFGEVDIVAKSPDGKYLCFVEVKTRRSDKNIASGLESVPLTKQRKIIKTAEYFIVRNRKTVERENLQPRFDCIGVNLDASGNHPEFLHITNAFDA